MSNTYLWMLFEKVTWVVLATDSFSKCNFEVLPTGSVFLLLILNLGTLHEARHFVDLDIEQGYV